MTPKLKQFFSELELTPIATNKNLKRFIYKNDTIVSFPFLNKFELPGLVFKLLKKCPTNIEAMSVKDFWTPLLGEKNCSNILTPILNGIYATPCEQLKFSDVFNTDFSFKDQNYFTYLKFLKSKMNDVKSVSFEAGMEQLPIKLGSILKDHISLNNEQVSFPPNSLICIDSSNILKNGNADIYSHSIMSTSIQRLNGSYGILFSGRKNILGILCNHQIFSFNQDPSYTIMSKVLLSKPELTKILSQLFKQNISISHYQVSQWPSGLPLYNHSRQDKIRTLNLKEYAYFGNYTSGISLRSLIEQTL